MVNAEVKFVNGWFVRIFAALCFLVALSGCGTVPAPKYQPSKENIDLVGKREYPIVAIRKFESKVSEKNKEVISIRSINMVSPYENSFARYLEEAIKLDLYLADRYSDRSDVAIKGTLLRNDLDGSGVNVGDAVAEVEISVMKNEQPVLKKVFAQTHQWESSFLGADAIPKAIKQYPILIEKLINRIFNDAEVIEAVKK